ncbi:MAG TPA: hypothetical protein VD763_07520 [Candidatus Saccharimonadales bacterium]|nr:hypothetical protein [Candidatus Saccharimonadales bacterium]
MAHRDDLTTFEALEEAWAALYTAWGERVVAEHRGTGPSPVEAAAYDASRRAFAASLDRVAVPDGDSVAAAGLATIRAALPTLDEYVPVAGIDSPIDGGADPELAAFAAATLEAYGEAASAIRIGEETIDRLTAFGRLATTPDDGERRAIFEAMAPVWRAIAGDGADTTPYRRIVAGSAARWARDGSVIDANAAVLGIEPGRLEPMLESILRAGRRLLETVTDGTPIEPWDYRFVIGAAERALGPLVPLDRLQAINDAHLRALGADPLALGIRYDVAPRPGRPVIPLAFTVGVGIPAVPWIFATYREGGLGNLAELLHESGHAIHMAAIRTRPCFAEAPADHAAFFEAIADVIGWDTGEPAFQRQHLGAAVDHEVARLDRYGHVLLDVCWALFEIALHRDPTLRPNDVWTRITHDGLGIVAHPEWSWWAVRGQLVEAPGYLANYALSAIAAAAIRARLRSIRGDWSTGDPGWYPYVAKRLLRSGAERAPGELLERFLGRPLTADALLADLAGSVA